MSRFYTSNHIEYVLWGFFFFYLFLLCLWVFCLHVWMCTTYVSGAHGGQKGEPEPLEQELQKFISHHVGAGNWTQTLCKIIK